MPASLDALYPIAERWGGYFTTAHAHELGVSDQQLHYLTKSGSLERVARGIYRLRRFPPRPFEDVIVACLWAGEGSVASHETALAVYGITDAMPPVIHVTVPRPFRGRREGVVVHSALLREDERTTREGVPVTTPARTIRDVWSRYGPDQATRAAREALARGIVTRRRLVRELASGSEPHPVLGRLESAL